VFQGEQLDGNGTTQMGPAIESPMVLEGNWCAARPRSNPSTLACARFHRFCRVCRTDGEVRGRSPDGTMDNPGFECYAGTHF
jgi:hypothetical protein